MLPNMGDWAKWIDHAIRVAGSSGYNKGKISGLEEAASAQGGRLKTQVDLFNEGSEMRKSIADAIRARMKIHPKR